VKNTATTTRLPNASRLPASASKKILRALCAPLCALCVIVSAPSATASTIPSAQPTPSQAAAIPQKAALADYHPDLVYKKVGDLDCTLDLLLPKTKTDKSGKPLFPNGTPVVLWFHGGSWAKGTRHALTPDDIRFFSNNGLALAQVSYRLIAKNNGIHIPDCVADCFDAARFLAQNASAYNLDPNNFLAHGNSAGGHLTLLMLLADPAAFPGDPALANIKFRFTGGVAACPPCTFYTPEAWAPKEVRRKDEWFVERLAVTRENSLQAAQKASPLWWLKKNSTRALIIQGETDPTVGVGHSLAMKKQATALGADLTVLLIPGANHAFKGNRSPLNDLRWQTLAQPNLRDMAREASRLAQKQQTK
jgi:acetyl esterase/lipase